MRIGSWLYQIFYPSVGSTANRGGPTDVAASSSTPTGPIHFDMSSFPGTPYGLKPTHGKPSQVLEYLMFNSGRREATSKLCRYRDFLVNELKKPHTGYIVLRNTQNGIVGTAAVLNKGKEAHIVMVNVTPNQRRRGLARWMMQTLIDHARERGFESVTLNVRNPRAIELYRSLGFEATGQTDLIDGKPYLLMKHRWDSSNRTQASLKPTACS